MEKFFWVIRAFIYSFLFKKIGKKSYLGKPLFIYGYKKISIGEKVRIYPHARIEVHGDGRIVLEDNISIGQSLHLISGGELLIKKNTTISGNVLITNLNHDYKEIDKHIMEQKHLIKETEIGENCFIGYGAAIQAGTKLGKQCVVGANSVVRGEFPDYCVIVGSPAKIIKKYNFETKRWEEVIKNE